MNLKRSMQRYFGPHLLFSRRFRSPSEPLRNPPPMECALTSEAEIHSLVSHQHVEIYLLAVRSFLRFYDQVKIMVHDDGSLSLEDQEFLFRQVRNLRLVARRTADRTMEEVFHV